MRVSLVALSVIAVAGCDLMQVYPAPENRVEVIYERFATDQADWLAGADNVCSEKGLSPELRSTLLFEPLKTQGIAYVDCVAPADDTTS